VFCLEKRLLNSGHWAESVAFLVVGRVRLYDNEEVALIQPVSCFWSNVRFEMARKKSITRMFFRLSARAFTETQLYDWS